jgi:tetratricopeptide (TPR) repeat protein
MKRLVVLVVLVGGSVLLSFQYHEKLYPLYVRYWHKYVPGENQEEMLDELRRLYRERESKELRQEARDYTILFPDDERPHVLLARDEVRKGNREEAALHYQDYLKKGPVSSDLFEEAVMFLFEMDYYGDVVYYMDRYEGTGSSDLVAAEGIALYHRGRKKEALEALLEAKNRGESSPELYLILGRVSRDLGQKERALRFLEEACRLDCRYPGVARNLADAYRDAGKYEKASRIMRQVQR